MAVDRSRFKPAPISAMKKQDGALGQRRGYSNYQKIGFHSIDSGDNKFRIYPSHPDNPDEGVFWYPKSTAFMSLEVELRDDDGEKTGETEIKRRPVFTSDVHGPEELEGKDLIKMYIDYAKDRFTQLFESEEEIKTASDLLYDWKVGVSPKLTWIMYADKYDDKGQKTLAFLEVSNGVKKKINEMASDLDSDDDPIQMDPFTDPEDGIAIIINKTGVKLNTTYKIEFEKVSKGKFNFNFVPTPLTDEDLEKFLTFDPLHKRFKNSFKRGDFEKQKEGLMRFDTENEFHFFEDEKWIEQMEEMQELVYALIKEEKPDSDEDEGADEEQEQEKEEPKAKPKTVAKKSIKEVKKPEPEPEEEEDDEQEEEEQDESEGKSKVDDRLAAIRARLSKKK